MTGLRLALRREQAQEQRPEPRAIGETVAHLLAVQREIRELLGRRTRADEVWARLEGGGR